MNGVLDLSGWDFSRSIAVKGEVLLYWDRLYDPSTIGTASVSEARLSAASRNWNYVKDGPPARGFGTYRLRVLLPRPDMDLGLLISNQDTAYRMWIEGMQVCSNGRVSADPRTAVPEYRDEVVFLHADGAELDMVLQMSNWDLRCGGWGNSIFIGEPKPIADMARLNDLVGVVPLFCLGFLFIYHLITWLLRTRELPHLYYGLALLFMAVCTGFSARTYPLYQALPFVPWVAGYKAQFVSANLFLLFFFLYLRRIFPQDIPRAFTAVIGAATLLLSVVEAFLPAYALSAGLTVAAEVYYVAAGVVCSVFVLLAAFRGRENALLILAGLLLVLLCAARDFLAVNLVPVPGSIGPVLPFGFLGFVVLHSFLLARRSALAYGRLDRLTEGLEAEVAQRTEELSAANERLTRADRERTDFFILLSHEIKTPLTLVINAMDDLARASAPDPSLASVRANLDVLLKEIMDFFDLLKVEKGIHVYSHGALMDLSAFAKGKADLFSSRARAHGLAFRADIQPGIILRADPSAIDRLLNNLLENAVKYNRPGGSVALEISSRDGFILLTVSDTGLGIPASQREAVFLPYYRVQDGAERGRVQGLGVGLAVVKSIVDSLSASITVADNEPRGARFTVRIPAPAASAADTGEPLVDAIPFLSAPAHPVPPAPPSTEPPAGAPSILVAEDNDELAEAVRTRLARSWRVRRARDGAEALALLAESPRVDLIVSDVMMPGMDGFAFLDAVKEREGWRDIPFLFLSAVTLDAERRTAYEKGALDFIHKPFHMDDLESKVRSLLRHQALLRDLEERRNAAGFGLLLSSVAHEIFNPLSAISAPLAVLKKRLSERGPDADALPDDVAARHIGHMEANVRRIEAIVSVIRDMQMGKPLPTEKVDLSAMLDVRAAACRERGPEVAWRCAVPPGLLVTANATALERVLANITDNALDAMPGGGAIDVDYGLDADGSGTLRIRDSGPGIPAVVLAAAFQPYVTTKGDGHMGVGLFLVRQLCARMGWDCRVQSPPGEGAAFFLRIPRETGRSA